MIATLLVCTITVSAQNSGNNILLTYTSVKEWKDLDKKTQDMLLIEVNNGTFNANVTLAGDSIIQTVLIKSISFSKTTSKTGIWIQMMESGKLVNKWFNGDKPPAITHQTNGKLNANGGNGDDDEYED
jgi:hypothetical protein